MNWSLWRMKTRCQRRIKWNKKQIEINDLKRKTEGKEKTIKVKIESKEVRK